MNKLKRIGWALFIVFVWPFYLLYMLFITPFRLPKTFDEPPPYQSTWGFSAPYEVPYELRFKDEDD